VSRPRPAPSGLVGSARESWNGCSRSRARCRVTSAPRTLIASTAWSRECASGGSRARARSGRGGQLHGSASAVAGIGETGPRVGGSRTAGPSAGSAVSGPENTRSRFTTSVTSPIPTPEMPPCPASEQPPASVLPGSRRRRVHHSRRPRVKGSSRRRATARVLPPARGAPTARGFRVRAVTTTASGVRRGIALHGARPVPAMLETGRPGNPRVQYEAQRASVARSVLRRRARRIGDTGRVYDWPASKEARARRRTPAAPGVPSDPRVGPAPEEGAGPVLHAGARADPRANGRSSAANIGAAPAMEASAAPGSFRREACLREVPFVGEKRSGAAMPRGACLEPELDSSRPGPRPGRSASGTVSEPFTRDGPGRLEERGDLVPPFAERRGGGRSASRPWLPLASRSHEPVTGSGWQAAGRNEHVELQCLPRPRSAGGAIGSSARARRPRNDATTSAASDVSRDRGHPVGDAPCSAGTRRVRFRERFAARSSSSSGATSRRDSMAGGRRARAPSPERDAPMSTLPDTGRRRETGVTVIRMPRSSAETCRDSPR